MKVWIVGCGERYEGYSISGVYETEEKARAAALVHDYCFDEGWVEKEHNYWVNGCDFLFVKEYEVK